ncbi:MAG: hypothetical protein IPN32_21385 [Deltaproteobacteria bacterium]|nr:hypothetical protein [Deltaproteobacteria bacterium]
MPQPAQAVTLDRRTHDRGGIVLGPAGGVATDHQIEIGEQALERVEAGARHR